MCVENRGGVIGDLLQDVLLEICGSMQHACIHFERRSALSLDPFGQYAHADCCRLLLCGQDGLGLLSVAGICLAAADYRSHGIIAALVRTP